MLKVITFDGDDTLWDFQAAMRRGLRYCLTELEQVAPKAADGITTEWMASIRDQVAEELNGTGRSLNEIRYRSFSRMVNLLGIRDAELGKRLTDIYFKHRYSDIHVFPDVVPALASLSKRFTLGIVSNGNTHPHHGGIEGYFTFTVHAEDHGVEKPDPRIFRIVHAHTGASPAETLHVGDSLETDIRGAHNAGVRSVWLNRVGIQITCDIQPDFEIRSLADLSAICLSRPFER